MAKGNSKMMKPQQGKSSYIDRNVSKSGYNFMALKTKSDMMREMPIILREFGNKKISIEEYGGMFLYNQFTEACIEYCEKQIALLNRFVKGSQAMYNCGWMDEIDIQMYQKYMVKINMYNRIMSTVQCCKYYKSVAPMQTLQDELFCKYKEYIQNEVKI